VQEGKNERRKVTVQKTLNLPILLLDYANACPHTPKSGRKDGEKKRRGKQ